MKKGDWMIASCILTAMLLSFAAFWVPERDAQERQAVIIVDGTEYARYKLSPNFSEIIEINTQFGYNKLEIDCGKIRMLDASCEDKIDVKMGTIEKVNETIICLPNRVLVTIKGQSEVDMVSY